jgi:hypothetical protein
VMLTTLQILQIHTHGCTSAPPSFWVPLTQTHGKLAINVSTAVLCCLLGDITGTIYDTVTNIMHPQFKHHFALHMVLL